MKSFWGLPRHSLLKCLFYTASFLLLSTSMGYLLRSVRFFKNRRAPLKGPHRRERRVQCPHPKLGHSRTAGFPGLRTGKKSRPGECIVEEIRQRQSGSRMAGWMAVEIGPPRSGMRGRGVKALHTVVYEAVRQSTVSRASAAAPCRSVSSAPPPAAPVRQTGTRPACQRARRPGTPRSKSPSWITTRRPSRVRWIFGAVSGLRRPATMARRMRPHGKRTIPPAVEQEPDQQVSARPGQAATAGPLKSAAIRP